MPWRIAALALALAAFTPWRADGRQVWGTVPVPGGASAARLSLALGSSGDRPDELWLLDFVDRYVALGNREIGPLADRYFQFMAGAEAYFATQPDGCALPPPGADRTAVDRARECLGWLGLRVRERGGANVAEPESSRTAEERRGWLQAAGIDALPLVATLNEGGRATAHIPRSDVPLPLPRFWSFHIFNADAGSPDIASITRHADVALIYAGLLSLDDDTLAFFDNNVDLLRTQTRDDPVAFAMFGRSLRIRDGRLEPPGGEDAAALWEHLAGERLGDPRRFVPALFARDSGRLAFFFDAASRLDPARQQFLLGAHLDGKARAEFVDRIYSRFRSFDATWRLRDQPLQFRPFDPAIAIAFVDVAEDGTIGPDWWRSLLERVTGSTDWPERPDQTLRRLRETPADAGWLLSWLFDRPEDARERFELVRYLQRQFPDLPRERAHDVELALRTRREMPGLALSLERMGVSDPALVGRMGRGARRLSSSGSQELGVRAVTRWQAAFGVLEQVHRHRRLAPEVLTPLLESLADAAAPGDDAGGQVTSWVVERFLLELAGADARDIPSEFEMIVGLLRPTEHASPSIVWDGLVYRLDRRGPAAQATADIRAMQVGPRVVDLIVLHRARRAIEAGVSSLEALAEVTASLVALGGPVAQIEDRNDVGKRAAGDWRDVVRNLGRINRDQDLGRAARELPRLVRVIDAAAEAVLLPMVYAMATAPTSQPAALFADAWQRHVLVEPAPVNLPEPRAVAWLVPFNVQSFGAGAAVHGSLLALDVALADAQLRTVPTGSLQAPPLVYDEDRRALVESLALGSADEVRDGAGIVAAVHRGRARTDGWVTGSPISRREVRDALESAGVETRRVNLLLWLAGREPARFTVGLTVTELYWLGGGGTVPAAWGVAGRAADGCLCLEALEPWRARWHRDRPGSGLAGSLVTDLPFRLAEHLEALSMPTALVAVMMRSALRDWSNAIWQIVPSDAGALAKFPSGLTVRRMDDYLMALVADRFLVSPDGGQW